MIRCDRNGAELAVDTLIALGCRHLFNITGLGMHSLAASIHERRSEIELVGHLNETNLCLMAQGYARRTRKPAFCFVYHASGTALAMMALTTAWADHAPLVIVTSSNSTSTSGRDQYAAVPRAVTEMTTQFTKWSYEVTKVERIPEVLARAYSIALLPPMGPVHISIPSDLWDAKVHDIVQRDDFGRTRIFEQGIADEAGLEATADLLATAHCPVILVGSEVGQLGGIDAVVELAETLGAPVVAEDMPSYLGFPTSHAQYVGVLGGNKDLIDQADVIFAAGFEFTQLGLVGERLPIDPQKKLAILSVDPLHTTRQLWPDIAISGHPAPSLQRLADLVVARGVQAGDRKVSLAVCAERREIRRKKAAAILQRDRSSSPITTEQLIVEIRDFCGQDWTIVQIGSTTGPSFDYLFELDDPTKFHGLSGKGSAQGWGTPASVGIQLAEPSERVLTIAGDGNLMFSATAIWAAAKNRLPMIFVVVNNGGWASIQAYMKSICNFVPDPQVCDEFGWTFGNAPIDFVGLAKSLGLQAASANTAVDLARLLRQAADSRQPWLIEAKTLFGGGLATAVPDRDPAKA